MPEEKTPETEAAEKAAAEKEAAEEKAAAEKAAAEKDDPDAELLQGARDPDAVRNALKSERAAAKAAKDEAAALAKKVKEFEDRDKSEQEKAEQRAEEAEKKALEAERKLLRLEVAASKKLPASLASRLTGETKEELEADADELLKLVKTEATVDLDGGARTSTTPTTDPDEAIRRMAGRR